MVLPVTPFAPVTPSEPTCALVPVHAPRSSAASARRFFVTLDRVWRLFQVSRSGQYSIQRLREFHAYPQHTTPLRCLAICVLTPLPSMLFVILLECIPLAPPSLSYAKPTVWLRMAITTITMGYSYVLQFRQVMPELALAHRTILAIAMSASAMYVSLLALLGWYWTFPIPFGFVVTAWPYVVFLLCSFVAIVGSAPLHAITNGRAKALQLLKFILVQSFLVYVYPVYTAIFVWLDPANQPLFIVFLPLIKISAKYLMARTCVGTALEDQLPELTIFSVEIFNSLYISSCVSIAGSAHTTTMVVMILDAVQTVVNFRAVLARAKRMREKARQAGQVNEVALASAKQEPVVAERKQPGNRSQPAFLPAHDDLLTITRKLHFSCEYLVLVEYIECFIPLICVAHTAILAQLPNARYYPHMVSMHDDKLRRAVSSIVLYVAFEITSLVALSWLLARKIHVQTLYQLGFVLEKQVWVIQAKLFVWVTYSLTFQLEHSGMDFVKLRAMIGG